MPEGSLDVTFSPEVISPHHVTPSHHVTSSPGVKSSHNVGFYTRCDGFLYCDDVKVSDLHQELTTSEDASVTSPAFVYSRRQVEKNVKDYLDALKSLPVSAVLNFSMKSNYNLQILALLRSLGCGVTLVSGTERRVAREAGFEPQRMLLNGSGKARWEIREAVSAGVLLNVDSEFDLQLTIDVCRQLGTEIRARVLLRLNLDIDPKVHQYVSTGTAGSKFGLDPSTLSRVVEVLTSDPQCPVRVVGLHCHVGSTISDVQVFRESVQRLLAIRQELKSQGLDDLHILNVGGGLGIDYERHRWETQPYRAEEEAVKADLARLLDHLRQESRSHSDVQRQNLYRAAADVIASYVTERIPRSDLDSQLQDLMNLLGIADVISARYPLILQAKFQMPTPADLTRCLSDVFVTSRDHDVTLIFEPGRSLVGNAGALLTTACGVKTAGHARFVVVDGAMTDVIRPSLYGAYHHIYPAAPALLPNNTHPSNNIHPEANSSNPDDLHVMDVVGPVCESGDFLGKDRLFPPLQPGACVVVHDTGAYCSAMASNYNLRPRPAELLVEGSGWRVIRRADTLDDLMGPYRDCQYPDAI